MHVQSPVKIGQYFESEPDLMVNPFRDDYYAETGIYPKDVLLLIEVADSCLEKDINIKIQLYAEADIPEVRIIDVNGRRILQFSNLKIKSTNSSSVLVVTKSFLHLRLQLR